MEIVRAYQIMIPLDNCPHIPYWFSIKQAVNELEKFEFDINGRKSLPRVVLVFNQNYELLGLVRRRDMLRGLEPDLSQLLGINFEPSHSSSSISNLKGIFDEAQNHQLDDNTYDIVIKAIKKQTDRPVSDIMRPIKGIIDYQENLVSIIYRMIEHSVHMLPVTKNSEIVGVVRTVEVLYETRKIFFSD